MRRKFNNFERRVWTTIKLYKESQVSRETSQQLGVNSFQQKRKLNILTRNIIQKLHEKKKRKKKKENNYNPSRSFSKKKCTILVSPEILMRDHFNRIKGQVVINRGGVQRFSILAREGWISEAEREEKGCVVRVIKPRGNSIQLGNCKK